MSEKQYILVTGGAGYIGSHTVVSLIDAGYTPVIADDFRNSDSRVVSGLKTLTGKEQIVAEIDVADRDALRILFEQYNFSGIIHFAAYKAVGESVQHPLMYYRNNIDGLLSCLELAQEFNVTNFVFSSSCTVYGQPEGASVVNENSPTVEANSPYGATKQMCERIISDVHQSGAPISFLNLRYFNPVGSHHTALIGELPIGKPNNLLPYVTQTAIGKLDQLTVFGNDYNTPDGTCLRDYIHVMDLADAHVRGLRWLEGQNSVNECVNIGTGKPTSVLEIIHTFERLSGRKLNWKFGPRREGDVEQIYADVSKAESLLGWHSNYKVDEAIDHAWKWEQKLKGE